MSIETSYICDRCGARTREWWQTLRWAHRLYLWEFKEDKQLCTKCHAEFLKFMENRHDEL
jgi:DNA-directed RNA polymerase subunit RPC12/RpoP